jgi:hypothetical protein
MIAKSRAMLEGVFLSEELGRHVQDAFLWDMSVLFEEALRGVLASWSGGSLEGKRWSARVVDPLGVRLSISRVKPDYVMTTATGRLVLDAKYKEVLRRRDEEEAEIEVARTRIRVGRADIYQAVSYSRHEGYAPATPALIYPVALHGGEQLPAAHRVEGFQQDVLILFLDVGLYARANLPVFTTGSRRQRESCRLRPRPSSQLRPPRLSGGSSSWHLTSDCVVCVPALEASRVSVSVL